MLASLLPASTHPMSTEERTISVRHRTAGHENVVFNSACVQRETISQRLQRIAEYLSDGEPEMPHEVTLTARKRFRDMYVRF